MHRTDEELVQAYLAGDELSLRDLVARYLRPLYHFAYRYTASGPDAEDIVQETFVKAWKNLRRYDPDANFRTWLFTIARRTAIDWLRKKKSVPFSAFDPKDDNPFDQTLVDSAALPDEVASRHGTAMEVAEVLGQLPTPARAVLRLRYQNDLTFRTIARLLKKPLNTVKSQHRRALARLKQLFVER